MTIHDIAKMKSDLHAKREALKAIVTAIDNRADKKYTAEEKTKTAELRQAITAGDAALVAAEAENKELERHPRTVRTLHTGGSRQARVPLDVP